MRPPFSIGKDHPQGIEIADADGAIALVYGETRSEARAMAERLTDLLNGNPQPITSAQARILAAARKFGELRKSAVARRPIERLRDLGLVTFEVEIQPDALRGRHSLVYVVRPVVHS